MRWMPLLCLFAAFSAGGAARAAIVNVGGSNGLAFSPQTVTVNLGDSVTFINKGGNHNAVADDGSFRCAHGCDGDGHGGTGNASGANWVATVVMTKPGTFGYFCEIHGMPGSGMYGTIIVQGGVAAAPEAVPTLDWRLLLALGAALGAIALGWRRARRLR